jgi:4-hydroxybenzoate polyprenyltransferase
MQLAKRLPHYVALMRLDKLIGIWLLLWPTLWALWLANGGMPAPALLAIFTLGTIIMRSLGCVVNDMADRHIDGHVNRTQHRPLAQGQVSLQEARQLAVGLALIAGGLVLFCNALTIALACIGLLWTLVYPLTKRWIHLPQAILGIAFSWSVPMAFAATQSRVSAAAWFLFFACMLWPVIYDTMYAMVDREDDVRLGVKSSAIFFGKGDRWILAVLQAVFVWMLYWVGQLFDCSLIYQVALIGVSLLFLYQQWLIRHRDPAGCFAAFLNQRWVGLVIFLGICLS